MLPVAREPQLFAMWTSSEGCMHAHSMEAGFPQAGI